MATDTDLTDQNDSSIDQRLLVHLEEYKAITEEINVRLKHQNSLFNWSLVFLAAISGTLLGYPQGLVILVNMRLQWVFLLVPLVFIAISFDYQAQYFMMANLASYLNTDLRRRISRLLGLRATNILSWQDYLMKHRMESGFMELLSWNARYLILVAMPLLWMSVYQGLVPAQNFTAAEIALISIDTVGIVLLIYSNLAIAGKFLRLTKKTK